MRRKITGLITLSLVAAAIFLSSCNPKPIPLKTSTGAPLQDTVLPKLMVKLVHNGSFNYLAYYWANSLIVDTTTSPPRLTVTAQSARYDSSNSSFVLHNGSTTSQVSSSISLYTDTVAVNYCGPFDPTTGQFCTVKGYLHYKSSKIGDTCICPIASVIYYNQSSNGSAISVGYTGQADLHSPAPPSDQR